MIEALFVLMLVQTSGLDRATMARDHCDGARAAGDVAELEALGEAARRILLEMAAGGGLEAGCAFEHLANLGDERVLPSLRRSLADENELVPVRRQAAAFAGLFGDREALEPILGLLASEDYGTMVSSLSALGGIDAERARGALREALLDDDFELVRPTVIRSIGRQRDPRAMEALGVVADEGKLAGAPASGNQLRAELALAFARIGTPEAHRRAVEMLAGLDDLEMKQRLIRDVGREIRRQMESSTDPDRVARMDDWLRRLARMYRAE